MVLKVFVTFSKTVDFLCAAEPAMRLFCHIISMLRISDLSRKTNVLLSLTSFFNSNVIKAKQ